MPVLKDGPFWAVSQLHGTLGYHHGYEKGALICLPTAAAEPAAQEPKSLQLGEPTGCPNAGIGISLSSGLAATLRKNGKFHYTHSAGSRAGPYTGPTEPGFGVC